ncbi:cytochrome-c peroxidase [Massilia endophytica]|uniref:cytochrome-c peroxidase n=1 Tax=Massilia endophytica TaxID=2899220 RepID=UPI001E4AA888|nr:cytochrome c peroxidase [Massilia endophytica]UGQ49137.1 cytochrome-c peroxidase [Massilia endophytica]
MRRYLGSALAAAACVAASLVMAGGGTEWSAAERAVLATLRLNQLPPAPADPSNRVATLPAAATLGKRLFFDRRLSSNGAVSCASCHDPQLQFQDGKAVAQGVGTGIRRTMPIGSAGHTPFLFWDGRKDSLWAQAVGPLEDAAEHGGNRLAFAHLMRAHYRQDYESVFGKLPDLEGLPADAGPLGTAAQQEAWQALAPERRSEVSRVLANIGKAIAAYERTLHHGETRLDRYIGAVLDGDPAAGDILSAAEIQGLRIFIGKGRCVTCHNGPLLSDQQFHNTGIAPHGPAEQALGRRSGAAKVLRDEFNCLGPYSDARPEQCGELQFLAADGPTLEGAFKAPSLRGVALRPPYMHAGQLAGLDAVIAHYRAAPPARYGRSELRPVALSGEEAQYLRAFLLSLDGAIVERER